MSMWPAVTSPVFDLALPLWKSRQRSFPEFTDISNFNVSHFLWKIVKKKFFFGTTSTQGNGFSSQSIHFLEKELLFLLKKMHSGKRNDVLAPTRVSLEFFCVSFNFLVFFPFDANKQNKTKPESFRKPTNKRTNESGFHWEQNLNECLELHFTV